MGPNWQKAADSMERSALNAPDPSHPTYQKHLAEVKSIYRTGGWAHSLHIDISHDPAPHDNRSIEEELDRSNRYRESEPDSVKAIRAMIAGKGHPAQSAAQNKPKSE
jgi:hypothetical protein